MKVRLRDISVNDLDDKTKTEFTHFVHSVNKLEKTGLELSAPDVVHTAFNLGLKTKNADVRMEFLVLRRSLRSLFSRPDKMALVA